MKKISTFIILNLLLIIHTAHAQAIPLNDLSLDLVFRHADEQGNRRTKSITVSKSDHSIKLTWHSLHKEKDEQARYPTYKIRTRRGMIETGSFDLKTALFLPALWGDGYMRVDTALPLWLDPASLELKGRQKKSFNVGLLDVNMYLLKLTPTELFEQIVYFQNLYRQYVSGSGIRPGIKLGRSEQRDLEMFVKEFSFIKRIARTRASLLVNRQQESYPALILGNEYFHLVVLDDHLNPLVISLRIFPEKVPGMFLKIFKKFKENFEFTITQLNHK